MTPSEWILELGFAVEDDLSPNAERLLGPTPQIIDPQMRELVVKGKKAAIAAIFQKAANGETFGEVSRIKQVFGATLEDKSGPFLAFAQAYWTFKVEMNDLLPKHRQLLLTQILMAAEEEVASVFFPTPGRMTIPNSKRREAQVMMLQHYAPHIDVDRFLTDNPLLQERRSGWWSASLLVVLFVASLGIYYFWTN